MNSKKKSHIFTLFNCMERVKIWGLYSLNLILSYLSDLWNSLTVYNFTHLYILIFCSYCIF